MPILSNRVRHHIAETVHHHARALAGIPAIVVEKTVLLVDVDARLLDLRRPHPAPEHVYDPDDYRMAESFGASRALAER